MRRSAWWAALRGRHLRIGTWDRPGSIGNDADRVKIALPCWMAVTPRGEGLSVHPVHLVDHRHGRVPGADEVGVQQWTNRSSATVRPRRPAPGRHLSTEDLRPFGRTAAAENVHLDLLQVEDVEQFPEAFFPGTYRWAASWSVVRSRCLLSESTDGLLGCATRTERQDCFTVAPQFSLPHRICGRVARRWTAPVPRSPAAWRR